MNEIFILLLSLSVTGSILAVILLLLKPVLKDRLSKTWQYYIYLVVILRLLIPFGFKIIMAGEMFTQVENHFVMEDFEESNAFVNDGKNETPQIPLAEANGYIIHDNTAELSKNINYWKIISDNLWLIWIVAALALLVRKIAVYHSFVQFMKVGCCVIDNADLLQTYQKLCAASRIKKPPAIYKNNIAASPMLVGLIQPFIVLPDLELKDQDMCYVLQHELIHYKRLDIFYKWLVQIAICVHWFNPFVYWISKEINRNCELSCDEAIIRQLDEKEKYFYGDTLLSAIKPDNSYSNSIVSITLNENTKLIKERLSAIMIYKKKSKMAVLITTLLSLTLLCGATFTGAYAASNHNDAQNNVPISIPYMEKEAVSVPDNYTKIVKTLDGSNVENIKINARMCHVVFEKASGNVFEAVFYYPDNLSQYYSKNFDLNMAQSGNTVMVSTNYDDFRENLYELDNSETLLIRIPEKKYGNISLELGRVENTNLDIWMETVSLYVDSSLNHLNIRVNNLSPNVNISNSVGDLTITLPEDPQDIKLMLNNLKFAYYSLPASWNETVKGEKAETVSYQSGSQTNKIDVTNEIGTFIVNIKNTTNQDMITEPSNNTLITAPKEDSAVNSNALKSYANFDDLTFAKLFNERTIKKGNYFSFSRIDVMDNNGYVYQAMVFICNGSDSYTKVFNTELVSLRSAYPDNYGNISGYLDLVEDNGRRNFGDADFFAIEKVILTDADNIKSDAYVIAGNGSDPFMESFDSFFDTVVEEYYEFEFKP